MASYRTQVSAKSAELPVSLQEAKTQLRIYNEDLDSSVQIHLEAAVDYCERVIGRSLRVSHTVAQTYREWPCNPVRFDRHPVKSIASVTYRDADDTSQTVASTNYRLITSTDAASYLELDSDFSRPSLYGRDDAVTINYVAGYASVDDVPRVAKLAILLRLEHDWGDKTPQQQAAIERSAQALLTSCDWGSYR